LFSFISGAERPAASIVALVFLIALHRKSQT